MQPLSITELGPGFVRDPYQVCDELRTTGPVHHVRMPNGLTGWLILDYRHAREALSDDRLRKDAATMAQIVRRQGHEVAMFAPEDLRENMLNCDPPEHNRLRRLVDTAFTARTVERLRPRVDTIADELLDRMASQPRADLITDYALPIPVTVISEMLGVPEPDRDRFRQLSLILTAAPASMAESEQAATASIYYATLDERAAASAEMTSYLEGLIADRADNLGEDLLSHLVTARDDNDALTEKELVATVFLLLVAGHETTINLIGNGLLALLRDQLFLDAVREDPERIPPAVEEFLRWEGPVKQTLRFTAEAVTIGEVVIPADELVWISIAGADHDPARFDCPLDAKLDDDARGHLAFGHGIHRCVGAPLARAEAHIAIRKLLQRFPHIRLAAPDGQPEWRPSLPFRGLQSLPVELC